MKPLQSWRSAWLVWNEVEGGGDRVFKLGVPGTRVGVLGGDGCLRSRAEGGPVPAVSGGGAKQGG